MNDVYRGRRRKTVHKHRLYVLKIIKEKFLSLRKSIPVTVQVKYKTSNKQDKKRKSLEVKGKKKEKTNCP